MFTIAHFTYLARRISEQPDATVRFILANFVIGTQTDSASTCANRAFDVAKFLKACRADHPEPTNALREEVKCRLVAGANGAHPAVFIDV